MRMSTIVALLMTTSLPAAAQAADFNGPRLQLLFGYDKISYNSRVLGIDKKHDDTTFGIASGYDFQLDDHWIVGAGLSTTLSSNKVSYSTATNRYKVEAKRDLEIAGRVGYIIGDAALVYGKVGLSNSKFKASSTVIATGIKVSDSKTENGLRLGVGTEIALFGPVALVGEYRYTTYGKGRDRNQVLGGIGFRF